jgi:hypothetical protein
MVILLHHNRFKPFNENHAEIVLWQKKKYRNMKCKKPKKAKHREKEIHEPINPITGLTDKEFLSLLGGNRRHPPPFIGNP